MDKNTLLAILLSAIVLILWHSFVTPRFIPPPKLRKAGAEERQTDAKTPPATSTEGTKDPAPTAEGTPKESIKSAPEKPTAEKTEETKSKQKGAQAEGLPEAPLSENIELMAADSPFLTTWTNKGAALKRLTFRDYYKRVDHKENLTLLEALEGAPLHLALTNAKMVSGKDVEGPVEDGCELNLETRQYEPIKGADGTLTFKTGFKNGLEVAKTFALEKGAYALTASVQFRNCGAEPIKLQYTIVACGGLVPESAAGASLYTAVGTMDTYGRIAFKKTHAGSLKKPNTIEGEAADLVWAGCDDIYFAAMLHPIVQAGEKIIYCATAEGIETPLPEQPTGQRPIRNATVVMTSYPIVIAPGKEVAHRYTYYVGPKDKDILIREQRRELLDLVDYGWFGSISKLLLWILDGFHRVIPNYGFGIIFLTFVVRIVLHPLSRKTQISMTRMQKLQPHINELKERHKNDPKRMQMEQWELFKKHNVNPLGGCLPMFIQIPVFLGLFNALRLCIVFRQAPFVLWIKDLSQPDQLANLPIYLPFGIGNRFNVMPILMTITWLVQQGTMPKPADPQQQQQQKVMMIMPVVFGFMLYNMASGLTLYWMVSTLLGIFEQMYIKKLIAQMPDIEPPESTPKKIPRRFR